jgi:hypothetical protein
MEATNLPKDGKKDTGDLKNIFRIAVILSLSRLRLEEDD